MQHGRPSQRGSTGIPSARRRFRPAAPHGQKSCSWSARSGTWAEHALPPATAALHAVDDLQLPRYRAGCRAEVAAHTAAGRRLLCRAAHAGRGATRPVLHAAPRGFLALRAHTCVQAAAQSLLTAAQSRLPTRPPRQRQIKLRPALSLGRPRPTGRCVLTGRHTGLAFHTGTSASRTCLGSCPERSCPRRHGSRASRASRLHRMRRPTHSTRLASSTARRQWDRGTRAPGVGGRRDGRRQRWLPSVTSQRPGGRPWPRRHRAAGTGQLAQGSSHRGCPGRGAAPCHGRASGAAPRAALRPTLAEAAHGATGTAQGRRLERLNCPSSARSCTLFGYWSEP